MQGAWDYTPVEPSLILPGVSANTSQMLAPLPSVAFAPSICRRRGNTLKVLQMLQQLLHTKSLQLWTLCLCHDLARLKYQCCRF